MAETKEAVLAVDPNRVPGATQAEFGKRELAPQVKKELADLEAEINAAVAQGKTSVPPVVPSVAQPAPIVAPQTATVVEAQTAPAAAPAAAAAPPQAVPEKFQTPEGALDTAKLQQSMVNLDEFLAKEKLATKLAQQKALAEQQALMAQQGLMQPPQFPYGYQPQVSPQVPPAYVPPVSPQEAFEQQLNADLQKNPAAALIGLQRAALQVNEERQQDLRMKLELMEIAQKDPAVFTAEGLQKLSEIRAQNPWLDASPTPWTNAWKLSGGIGKQLRGAVASTQGTAPQQTRPSAPALPGGQATPPSQTLQSAGPASIDPAAILAYAKQTAGEKNLMGQADAIERLINAVAKAGKP